MNQVALAAQDAQPAVAENTGSAGLAASTGTTPSKARAVAETPARLSRVGTGRGDENERPMLFSAPMVRAILDGRKTQTRRVVKHRFDHLNREPWFATGRVLSDLPKQPGAFMEFRYRQQDEPGFIGSPASALVPCPCGHPGDRLWVRESGWERPERTPKMMREGADTWPRFAYAADGWSDDDRADFKRWGFKVRPSIHMPRWASRILLEIVAVRVERLNDISEKDSIAEGIGGLLGDYLTPDRKPGDGFAYADGRGAFRHLWESINGQGSWAANPWVWVIEFKRLTP